MDWPWRTSMVEGAYMLRSITIDNKMLRYLADKINQEVKDGNKVTRSFLSNAIWDYEKKGKEDDWSIRFRIRTRM